MSFSYHLEKFRDIKSRVSRKWVKYTWKLKKKIEKEDLVNDLKKIGLKSRSVLCIHSSLSRIGKVNGGAATVLAAILETFSTTCTVLFPSYTLPSGSMEETLKSGFIFDVKKSKTTLGAIPEIARRNPEFIRSVHPTHSFIAIGPLAEDLLMENHLAITPTGKGSPLYKMSFMENAYLLLLGSPFGAFTSGHCVQDRINDYPYQPYSETLYMSKCKAWDDSEVKVMTYAHNSVASKYRWDHNEQTRSNLFKKLHLEGILNYHKVGCANTILINCVDLEAALEKLLSSGLTIFGSLDRLKKDPETEKFILNNRKIFWQR